MAGGFDWKDAGYAFALIFVLGILLIMLGPYVNEGFANQLQRCDLDNPCSGTLKCINGFCSKTDPLPLINKDPVEMLPEGGPAPYF